MRAIINRKRYDTDTATKIAFWSNGASYGDFNRCEESLYQTKGGAFFLCGEGGGLSKYACSIEGGRASGSGSEIIPLTQPEALDWCEEHDQGDAIEEHFAAEITDA